MKWIDEKVTITLTRRDMFNLGNVFHDAQYAETEFLKWRNRFDIMIGKKFFASLPFDKRNRDTILLLLEMAKEETEKL